MALPASRRLRRSKDISRAYTKGRRGRGHSLFVRAVDNRGLDCRATVVVGRKVSKKATVRNKIRRQLISHLAGAWSSLLPGQDIVVYVTEDLSGRPPTEQQADLTRALKQAAVLKDSAKD